MSTAGIFFEKCTFFFLNGFFLPNNTDLHNFSRVSISAALSERASEMRNTGGGEADGERQAREDFHFVAFQLDLPASSSQGRGASGRASG